MKKLLALASLALIGGTLGFVAAGCGSEKAVSLGPAGGKTGTTAVTEPTGSVPTSVSLEVWFLKGEQLVRQTRSHEATPLVATAAMKALLAGPSPAELAAGLGTSVPAGTKLLGIAIKKGVATVDLTSQYQSGGGSLSMKARLAQVVYTLTQFSTVRAVLFQVEGRTVTTFGSEGIVLDGPQTRKDFDDLLPSIFVDRPAFGAAANNPARISGNANVFEATFRVALLDASRKVLVDQMTMATCGTGCRGTFDVTLRYDVAKAQWGTLRVYFGSAVDGSPEDIRDDPVWLTPN